MMFHRSEELKITIDYNVQYTRIAAAVIEVCKVCLPYINITGSINIYLFLSNLRKL